MKSIQILVTLGPSSMNYETVNRCSKEGVGLFRINLSHTPLDNLEEIIDQIQEWTDVPLCIDSEGAQIRSGSVSGETVTYKKGDMIRIVHEGIVADSSSISFTPTGISRKFEIGDIINVDFDSVSFEVVETAKSHAYVMVRSGGTVASNRAADLSRYIDLPFVSPKDIEAIKLGLKKNINHFALSFSQCQKDVLGFREMVGLGSTLISKIESIKGLNNLNEILKISDRILIDRGDLSRQVPIEKIPFFQRYIIQEAKASKTPVYVATNLLESMVIRKSPTRAEVNDVVSTLMSGADGLVLASETAVGRYPVQVVKMISSLIKEFEAWESNGRKFENQYSVGGVS